MGEDSLTRRPSLLMARGCSRSKSRGWGLAGLWMGPWWSDLLSSSPFPGRLHHPSPEGRDASRRPWLCAPAAPVSRALCLVGRKGQALGDWRHCCLPRAPPDCSSLLNTRARSRAPTFPQPPCLQMALQRGGKVQRTAAVRLARADQQSPKGYRAKIHEILCIRSYSQLNICLLANTQF